KHDMTPSGSCNRLTDWFLSARLSGSAGSVDRRLLVDPNIASLLSAAERGDGTANEALFAALYAELHRLAKRELARPGNQGTLGVTTLLHEAYLEMAGPDGPVFPDRARFMGYAARVMR